MTVRSDKLQRFQRQWVQSICRACRVANYNGHNKADVPFFRTAMPWSAMQQISHQTIPYIIYHHFLSDHQTRNQWIYECLETGGVSMKANKIGWNSLSFVKGVLDWLYKRSNECDLHIQDLIVIKDCKKRLNYLNRVGHETILMKSVIMCCAVGDSVMAPALFAFCFVSCWGLGNLSHWHDHDLREYEAGMLQRWRLLNGSESNKLRQAETLPWWKTMQIMQQRFAETVPRCFGRTNLATRRPDTQDSPYKNVVRLTVMFEDGPVHSPNHLEPILAPTPENHRPAEILLRNSMLHQSCSAWRWDIPPNGPKWQ